MAAERCEAIVLRRRRFSESSLVLTFLTRERGRVDAIAKGCRREKSPLRGHFDLFVREDALVYPSRGDGLGVVAEGWIVDEYEGLRRSPAAFACAACLGETALAGCFPGDAHPRAFDAIHGTFAGLSRAANPAEVAWTAAKGLWLLLADMGFQPGLDRCAACKGALTDGGRSWSLSAAKGGFLCGRCAPKQPDDASLPASEGAHLREWVRAGGNGIAGTGRALLAALTGYAEVVLGQRLKSRPVVLGLLGKRKNRAG